MVITSNPGEEVFTVDSEQRLLWAQISNLLQANLCWYSVKLWATKGNSGKVRCAHYIVSHKVSVYVYKYCIYGTFTNDYNIGSCT